MSSEATTAVPKELSIQASEERTLPLPIFYLVAGFIFVVDQVTKHWISSSMTRGESRQILGDFFRLTYVHNDGAAFGLNLGGRWAFITVTVAVTLFILFSYSRKEKSPLARWALALVLGGALGNLADRVRIGEVVDFFHFGIGGVYWPIFNVADIGVSVGVGLLAIHLFRQEPSTSPPSKKGDESNLAESPHSASRQS